MQKDIAEKSLESYNDVFADIVNGLLFNGEEIVKENQLVDSDSTTSYKIEHNLHEQRRDVAKFWTKGKIQICLLGLENQTVIDNAMPLRIINYDAANYRSQLSNQRKYPVVTIVLYFGEGRWRNRNLHSCLEIPAKLVDYVSDYKINVFEIPWLEPEQVNKFKSDFKIVADFFVQKRINKFYAPSKDIIRHVDAILKTMSVLTGDSRYEEAQQHFYDKEAKEEKSMCEILDKYINDGIQIGISQGINKGISQGVSKGIRMTAKNFIKLNVTTDEQISIATGLSLEEIKEIRDEIKKESLENCSR